MIIYQLERGETADYASAEIIKYLKLVSGVEATVKFEKGEENGITLATFETLGLSMKDIEDKKVDDAYDVDVKNLNGYIAGSNIRSILYGIYAYFYAAGCRFLRPGENGEYIPEKDLYSFSFSNYKKAEYRYRCDCLEGSISYEMVNERLRWLLKVGYNGYLIQGITPTAWLDRWYSHLGNKYKEGKRLTLQEEFEITLKIEKDIKRYGLLFHDVGHGYLFPAYGIYRNSEAHEIGEELKSHLALRDGERKIMHGSLQYTNLCYSNPAVRKKISDYFVGYLREHDVDFLHVWLADNSNNECQCEECSKATLSDHYITLLNDLDKAFEENKIDTKIVFVQYADTVRAPKFEKIINQDRFVFMPSVRQDGVNGYASYNPEVEKPDFSDINYGGEFDAFSTTMRFKDEWQKMFKGEMLFFDFHFYSGHFTDLGHTNAPKRVVRDIKLLEKFGSKGIMICSTPRFGMPTSLPPYAGGRALFDDKYDYEIDRNDYFKSAFGDDCEMVKEYLEKLSELFLPDLMNKTGIIPAAEDFVDPNVKVRLLWMNNKEAYNSFSKIKNVLDNFLPVIEKNIIGKNKTHRESWKLLKIHNTMCMMLSEALVLGTSGDMLNAQKKVNELIDFLARREDDYAMHFDFMLYVRRLRLTFGITDSLFAPVE